MGCPLLNVITYIVGHDTELVIIQVGKDARGGGPGWGVGVADVVKAITCCLH